MKVTRFGVSLEEDLLGKLDDFAGRRHFPNRSQAIRHLIRSMTVDEIWEEGLFAAGAIVLIYDHHKGSLVNELLEIQHDYGHLILCSQHVHMDHENCLEAIVVRGRAAELRDLSDRLISIKGMKHGKLVMSGV